MLCQNRTILYGLIVLFSLTTVPAFADYDISEIIDSSGDGAGNSLDGSEGLTVDSAQNVYVVGKTSNNVFKITPAGVITEISE